MKKTLAIVIVLAVIIYCYNMPRGSVPHSLTDMDLRRINTITSMAVVIRDHTNSQNEYKPGLLIKQLPEHLQNDPLVPALVDNLQIIQGENGEWTLREQKPIPLIKNADSILPPGRILIGKSSNLKTGIPW